MGLSQGGTEQKSAIYLNESVTKDQANQMDGYMKELLQKFESFENNQRSEFGQLNERINHIDHKVNQIFDTKKDTVSNSNTYKEEESKK